MSKKVITGKIENRVHTWEGDSWLDLEIGGESFESVFRSYEGQNIRVTIEVLENEETSDEVEDNWEDD